jgi:hypothetical protein
MNGSGYDLFTGSSLAQQQYRPAAAAEFIHHPHDVPYARRLADQNMVRCFGVTNHFVCLAILP